MEGEAWESVLTRRRDGDASGKFQEEPQIRDSEEQGFEGPLSGSQQVCRFEQPGVPEDVLEEGY